MTKASSVAGDAEGDIFPLSFAQQRLWLLDQLTPGRASYNIAGAFKLESPLNPEALMAALNEIVRRHEVLRTTFLVNGDGEPVQLVAPDLRIALPLVDLADVPASRRMSEALQYATELARMPFDLACGPLLRAQLLRLSESEHVFAVAMHHIISDGWSMGILFDELAALYSALVAGRLSPLAELPVQYADYAVWQREWLQGETLQRQMRFWQKQLAGLAALQLATDRPRPPVASHCGASFYLELSNHLAAALKALSHQEGLTLFMTLLAAFQVLLYRYTGQEDIVVGSPTAGRNRPELERLIGFFVNMLVMRSDLSGDPSFRELMKRVRGVALDAYAHQDLPFEKLVEELQPARDLSRNPLFQVAFQLFQEGTGSARSGEPESASRLEVEKGTANFDLAFSLWEDCGHLRGRLEYSTDLFVEETIVRLAGHFRVLLESIVANPDCSIATLPLLTSDERSRLLDEMSSSASISKAAGAEADWTCVHQLFEEQAARNPDALALATEGIRLSRGELNRRANQLADRLGRLDVGPDTLVALCLDRSPSLVIAELGVLKAGGAFLLLDPAWPAQRLAFTLADARAVAVVTEASSSARLPLDVTPVLCLDENRTHLNRESEANPKSAANPTNLAYAICTSGSTGRPKCVLIQHNALANLVAWHRAAYAVTERDRATLLAAPAFDASVWEIWPYLAAGASLHIPAAETRDVPYALLRWLNSESITLAFVPTALAELLLQEQWPERTALRALLTGGDRLHRGPDRTLPCQIFNHYGPTESCVIATSAPVQTWREGDHPPPIGHPISQVQAFVLDPQNQLAPIGVPGELHLGGAGLARGYLNRAALTAEKFIPHPFSTLSGARLYRTGDRVRFRADGNLEFLGRLDQQVKLRGLRIELGEIEAVLAADHRVRKLAVKLWDAPGNDQRLAVYVVPRESEDLASGSRLINALQHLARKHLPDYMIPSEWIVLKALPLTHNGKIDRAALPIPQRAATQDKFEPPRTRLEKQMANLWSELLGVAQVGLHADFFRQMGGHSLLATRLVSRIRSAFKIELPLRAVFQTPTVYGLSIAVVQQQAKLSDDASLDRILQDVEALPDDAAGVLLADEEVNSE